MRRTSVSHLLVALTVVSLCGLGSAQDNSSGVPHGKYVVMPPHLRDDVPVPATSLQTWNGSFTYSGSNYGYNMVGTATAHERTSNNIESAAGIASLCKAVEV